MSEIGGSIFRDDRSDKKRVKKSDTSKEVGDNHVSYKEFMKIVKKTRIMPSSYKNFPNFDEISTEQPIKEIKEGKEKIQIQNEQTFEMYSGDISTDNIKGRNKRVSYKDFLRSVKKTRVTPLSSEDLPNFGERSLEQPLNDIEAGKKKVKIETEQFFDMYSGDTDINKAEESNKHVSYEDFLRRVKKTRITPLISEGLPNFEMKPQEQIIKDGIGVKKKVDGDNENILVFKSKNEEKDSEKNENTSEKLKDKTKKEPIKKSEKKIKEEKSKVEKEKKKEIKNSKEEILEEKQRSKEINREKEKSEEEIKSESSSVNKEKKELTSEKQKSQEIKREGEKTDQKQEKEKEENWNEILRKKTREERKEQIWNDPETEGINSDMLKLNNEANDIESIRTEINNVEPLKESIKEEQKHEDLRKGLKVGLEELITRDTGEEDFKNLEIPKDLFYKGKNGYHCKDLNLLRKIYETQKSFLKIESYLNNQDCKNVPSKATIYRLVQKSFKSKSEYNLWRCGIMLKEFQEIAEGKGGECLSPEYKNSKSKLKFRCQRGHEFEAIPNDVKIKHSWCPTCAGKEKLTLKEFQDIAKERGGECLSPEYKNCDTKLRFRCKRGHEFEAVANDVKTKDHWCPICLEKTGERIARSLFEAIFNKDFKKARPEWLKNSEGHQLELDGYNDELKLAFERQGIQHYKFPTYFHKTIRRFISQLSNDQEKGELCETHGITLIEIPYGIEYDEYQHYIIKQCKEKGINTPQIKFKIDWKKFKWNIDDNSNRSLKEWI